MKVWKKYSCLKSETFKTNVNNTIKQKWESNKTVINKVTVVISNIQIDSIGKFCGVTFGMTLSILQILTTYCEHCNPFTPKQYFF